MTIFNDDKSFVGMEFYNYVLSQKQIWYDRFSVLPAASRYQTLLVAGFITWIHEVIHVKQTLSDIQQKF